MRHIAEYGSVTNKTHHAGKRGYFRDASTYRRVKFDTIKPRCRISDDEPKPVAKTRCLTWKTRSLPSAHFTVTFHCFDASCEALATVADVHTFNSRNSAYASSQPASYFTRQQSAIRGNDLPDLGGRRKDRPRRWEPDGPSSIIVIGRRVKTMNAREIRHVVIPCSLCAMSEYNTALKRRIGTYRRDRASTMLRTDFASCPRSSRSFLPRESGRQDT